MALNVETGVGVANADSYISLADAATYFTNHSSTSWTGTDALKESALRYAATWLDSRYTWIGNRLTTTQALDWPRDEDYDLNGKTLATVPQCLKDAQCEAAAAHLQAAINEVRARGGDIESATVGPLSVTYASGAAAGRTFPFVDGLVQPIVISGPGQWMAVRG